MSIFKKISQKLEYAKMKNATITPKGICFREYCKKSVTINGHLPILLKHMKRRLASCATSLNRENM